MVTAIVSDLHLGLSRGADLLRRHRYRELLLERLAEVDRLVLLGDVIELRDRPAPQALEAAAPVIRELAEAMSGRELVFVAGNHDHHLIEDWLQRRELEGDEVLGLEQTGAPQGLVFEALVASAEAAAVSFAYPGLWVRDDVYAHHGHYLDRHLTVPTIERLGIGSIERVLGLPPNGSDPLEAPGEQRAVQVAEYERVQTPVYALLYGLAQATVGQGRGGAEPSMRLWQMLNGGGSRTARLRSWLLGSVAVPGAVGVANRLGLGPVRSDLSAGAIGRAGFEAMGDVVEALRIDAAHVIFGHTHRRGGDGQRGSTRLWNTGSWVWSPSLVGASAAVSPYWPGTLCLVDDDGDPELVGLLDDTTRDELELAG